MKILVLLIVDWLPSIYLVFKFEVENWFQGNIGMFFYILFLHRYVFLCLFLTEMLVRMYALGPRIYFESSFNRYNWLKAMQKDECKWFIGLTVWWSVQAYLKWSTPVWGYIFSFIYQDQSTTSKPSYSHARNSYWYGGGFYC